MNLNLNKLLLILVISAASLCYSEEINWNDQLIDSALNGKKDQLETALNNGADVNAARSSDGNTPLILSSNKGYTEIVDLLLQKGAQVNKQNNYGLAALSHAGSNGRTETVKLLLSKDDIKVDLQDNEGETALMDTAHLRQEAPGYRHSKDIIKLLLDKGASRTLKNNNGQTAADLAFTEEIRDYINNYKL